MTFIVASSVALRRARWSVSASAWPSSLYGDSKPAAWEDAGAGRSRPRREDDDMDVEFIGMIHHRHQTEIHPPAPIVLDRGYIRDFARAAEAGGFDRVLVGYFS